MLKTLKRKSTKMFKPPAHKSNSAGQIVNKVTQEDIDNGPHAGLGNIPSDYEEGWKPPRYLRDVIKKYQVEERINLSDWQKFDNALASLRHLYANLVGGKVANSEQAKSIAQGLLGQAIRELEGINNAKNK